MHSLQIHSLHYECYVRYTFPRNGQYEKENFFLRTHFAFMNVIRIIEQRRNSSKKRKTNTQKTTVERNIIMYDDLIETKKRPFTLNNILKRFSTITAYL